MCSAIKVPYQKCGNHLNEKYIRPYLYNTIEGKYIWQTKTNAINVLQETSLEWEHTCEECGRKTCLRVMYNPFLFFSPIIDNLGKWCCSYKTNGKHTLSISLESAPFLFKFLVVLFVVFVDFLSACVWSRNFIATTHWTIPIALLKNLFEKSIG